MLIGAATVAVLAVALGVAFVRQDSSDAAKASDDDLCPDSAAAIAATASFLVDLRKPLDEHQTLPGDRLLDVADELGRGTELRVYALASSPDAPRVLLGRVCKPYAEADLVVPQAKDRPGAGRNCYDLPAQIPPTLRASALRFCTRSDELRRRVNGLASALPANFGNVRDAHLAEAFEEARLEMAGRSGTRTLYVFSDMVQHAEWYSHLDREWTDWHEDEFLDAMPRRSGGRAHDGAAAGRGGGYGVVVFYVPRLGLTDHPPVRERHQAIWQAYFADAPVVYRDQPVMRGYAHERRLRPEEAPRLAAPEPPAVAAAPQDTAEPEVRPAPVSPPPPERTTVPTPAATEPLPTAEPPTTVAEPTPTAAETPPTAAERPPSIAAEPPPAAAEPQPSPTVPDQSGPEEAAPEQPEQTIAQVREPPRLVPQSPPSALPVVDDQPRPCIAEPRRPGSVASPAYPKRGGVRRDLGQATVTVRYTIEESGRTEDVEMLAEQSSASREVHIGVFEASAVRAVQRWSFAFVEPDEGACIRRQTREVTFEFSY